MTTEENDGRYKQYMAAWFQTKLSTDTPRPKFETICWHTKSSRSSPHRPSPHLSKWKGSLPMGETDKCKGHGQLFSDVG